ncbi:MAG: hypothetical protein WBH66_07520, partial [Rectinemataceae bacterium]
MDKTERIFGVIAISILTLFRRRYANLQIFEKLRRSFHQHGIYLRRGAWIPPFPQLQRHEPHSRHRNGHGYYVIIFLSAITLLQLKILRQNFDLVY